MTGATGYRVYGSAVESGPFEPLISVLVSGLVVTIESPGLSGGIWAPDGSSFQFIQNDSGDEPVYFTIRAFNDAGEGPASPVTCGSTDAETGC